MKFDYTIKNFRAFDSQGATFTISPITILTGTNSSGKSSVVKSMLLLNNYLTALKAAYKQGNSNPMDIPLDFSDKEALLGSYSKCLNFKAGEDDFITLAYKVHSLYLSQDCTVSWKFGSIDHRSGQKDGNGWISTLHILSDDGLFELLIDFSGWKQRILKYNRIGAKSAFFRTCKGLSIINANTSDKDGIAIYETGPHSYSYIIPDSARAIMSQEQFRDVYDIFLKDILSGELAATYENAQLAASLDDFWQSSLLDTLRHTPKKELFDFLSSHSDSKEWSEAVRSIEKDFKDSNAIDLEDYFRIKSRFWLSEGFDYPIMGDFFSTLKTITHINVSAGLLKQSGLHEKPLRFPVILNVLCAIAHPEDSALFSTLLDSFDSFCFKAIKEAIFPSFIGNMNYISSSRAIVRRIYTKNDKGSPFDVLLQRYDEGRKKAASDNGFRPGDFINRWLKKFGVGESLVIEPDGNGVGIIPSIIKNGQKTLLSDLGYGVTQLFSILLNIETVILFSERERLHLRPFYIIIEEPEIHLHPCLQSLLADMFLEAYLKYNVRFIIETHSEYLIRKYQYLVAGHSGSAEFGVDASEIGIYYLYDAEPTKRPEGQRQVQEITIQDNGRLSHKFGEGFYDISTSLVLELYSIRGEYAK